MEVLSSHKGRLIQVGEIAGMKIAEDETGCREGMKLRTFSMQFRCSSITIPLKCGDHIPVAVASSSSSSLGSSQALLLSKRVSRVGCHRVSVAIGVNSYF